MFIAMGKEASSWHPPCTHWAELVKVLRTYLHSLSPKGSSFILQLELRSSPATRNSLSEVLNLLACPAPSPCVECTRWLWFPW